jgi:hypothetical protein
MWPPRNILLFGTMIGNVELALEREPKTENREPRMVNDGPLSMVSLSRIVPSV